MTVSESNLNSYGRKFKGIVTETLMVRGIVTYILIEKVIVAITDKSERNFNIETQSNI